MELTSFQKMIEQGRLERATIWGPEYEEATLVVQYHASAQPFLSQAFKGQKAQMFTSCSEWLIAWLQKFGMIPEITDVELTP